MADYLSGALPVDVRQRFDYHLGICVNCQKYLSSYAEAVKLGKRAFDDEAASLPGDVPEDLVQAILAARPRSSS
jgi:anti-sigma factor RsiW